MKLNKSVFFVLYRRGGFLSDLTYFLFSSCFSSKVDRHFFNLPKVYIINSLTFSSVAAKSRLKCYYGSRISILVNVSPRTFLDMFHHCCLTLLLVTHHPLDDRSLIIKFRTLNYAEKKEKCLGIRENYRLVVVFLY